MVTAVSLVGLLVYFLVTATVACRLLRLARRTRQLPETTTGVGYLAAGMLGWSLVLAGHAPPVVDTTVGLVLRTLAVFSLSLGSLAIAVGTWRIFRPERPFVGGLCALLAVVLAVELARNALIHHTPFVRATSPWYWPGALGRALPFLWQPFEALRYHGMLRRRQQLGLAAPLMTNRFLLWALSGFTNAATTVLAVGTVVLDVDRKYPDVFLAAYAVLGVLGAVAIWLAFFPPAGYAALIARRAAVADEADEAPGQGA